MGDMFGANPQPQDENCGGVLVIRRSHPTVSRRIRLAIFGGSAILAFAQAGRSIPRVDCAGCVGQSGSQVSTSGVNMVSVDVAVGNGDCVGVAPSCTAEACEVTVTREWNLPIGITMNFCIVRPPPQSPLCVYPPPVVDPPGTGTDINYDLIRCGGTKTFNLTTSSLSAQATGSCSACQ